MRCLGTRVKKHRFRMNPIELLTDGDTCNLHQYKKAVICCVTEGHTCKALID